MATPANISLVIEYQDDKGFRALQRVNLFAADISDSGPSNIRAMTLDAIWNLFFNGATSVAGTLALMSNAKQVRQGIQIDVNYAQEPTSESGMYQLVTQKAKLNWGDGVGGFNHFEVPAPVDSLFLPEPGSGMSQDALLVVNPASSLLSNFQTAIAGSFAQGAVAAISVGPFTTPRGGHYGSQFFGGQLAQGKPRRRRVLQGQ